MYLFLVQLKIHPIYYAVQVKFQSVVSSCNLISTQLSPRKNEGIVCLDCEHKSSSLKRENSLGFLKFLSTPFSHQRFHKIPQGLTFRPYTSFSLVIRVLKYKIITSGTKLMVQNEQCGTGDDLNWNRSSLSHFHYICGRLKMVSNSLTFLPQVVYFP